MYYVKAYNSVGDSDPSNTDCARTDGPPSRPSLSSPPDGHTFVSCADITLDWNESSGASEYYAEYWGASSSNSGWIGDTDWHIGTLPPGTYYWHVKARNECGESGWSDTWSFTVNPNQAPSTPAPIGPDDGSWVNNRTVTLQWQVSSDDGCPRGVTYNAEIWHSGWSDGVSDHPSTSWQVTVPTDDDYQWHVQAYDGELTSGWSSDWVVRVDATPPDTSIITGPSGIIPTGTVTLTWEGSDNRTPAEQLEYTYRLVGLSDAWSSWSSDTSVSYNGLTDGDYTFEVKARDLAGNEDPSPDRREFGVDVTPPETTITAGPRGCIGTADVTFTWTGTDNRTPTAELFYSYQLEGFDADWSEWASDTEVVYTGLPDGDYTFQVKARDGVGHEDPSPAAQSFRVDTTPPAGSVLINGGDSTTPKIAVHLDITGDDGPVGCGVTEMRLSNDGLNWTEWESFVTEGDWLLPTIDRITWTVHLQLMDWIANISEPITDDIYLNLYPLRPSSENYQLGARIMASGDLAPTSGSYELLSATVGEPLANGVLQSVSYRLESGYQGAWPSMPQGRLEAESYDIRPRVMASGGGGQASESYQLQGTMGQPADVGPPPPHISEHFRLYSGYWSVSLPITPSVGTFEPNLGSGRVGEWVTFTTTYSDPNSYDDITWAFFFLDRQSPIASGGLAAAYLQSADLLWLLGDGFCRPGQAKPLSTDYVTLDCAGSSISGEGDTLAITWRVRPEQCFEGGCGWNYAVELVTDTTGQSDGGLVGWWRLYQVSGSAQEKGPAIKPTEADLEQLREEIEAWQSRLSKPYLPLIPR